MFEVRGLCDGIGSIARKADAMVRMTIVLAVSSIQAYRTRHSEASGKVSRQPIATL